MRCPALYTDQWPEKISTFLPVVKLCVKCASHVRIGCKQTRWRPDTWKYLGILLLVMRESNRNLDIPPPGIPGEFACLVFEECGNLTFFSSGRWGICLGGREFEFFF